MATSIQVPSMGESITEVVIGQILIPSGQAVQEEQEILEIETDKLNQVLFSPASGVMNLTVEQGQTVRVGDVIGSIEEGPASAQASVARPEVGEEKKPAVELSNEKAFPLKIQQGPSLELSSQAPIKRKTSKDFVAEVSASEKKAEQIISQNPVAEVPSSEEMSYSREETRQKMSKIRHVIAQRLVEAQNTAAMLTTFNEVDLSKVMSLRSEYKENFINEYDVKLGFMSFFVKASVYALKKVKTINTYIDGDDLVQRHYYDISIAVGTDRGLVVPVIRGCDRMSFAQIERAISDVAKRARTGRLSIDELQGGGFTITNGGVYGSLISTPILNTPQCAILGMHTIQKRAVVVNDEIVIRPMMYLALSYDHRIVDGKEAVTFLVHIKQALEDPSRLLLNI